MGSEIIQSRDDFFRVLDETIKMTSDRVRKSPKFGPYLDLEFQLDKMWRWTRDGRTPTEEERHSTDLGVIALPTTCGRETGSCIPHRARLLTCRSSRRSSRKSCRTADLLSWDSTAGGWTTSPQN